MVLVQGDTTSTLCGRWRHSMMGFRLGTSSGAAHRGYARAISRGDEPGRGLAAGRAPFRRHPWAARNLTAEGVPEHAIVVTGIQESTRFSTRATACRRRLVAPECRTWILPGNWCSSPPPARELRPGFERICEALRRISRFDGVEIVYPVHPNPRVAETVAGFSARGRISI